MRSNWFSGYTIILFIYFFSVREKEQRWATNVRQRTVRVFEWIGSSKTGDGWAKKKEVGPPEKRVGKFWLWLWSSNPQRFSSATNNQCVEMNNRNTKSTQMICIRFFPSFSRKFSFYVSLNNKFAWIVHHIKMPSCRTPMHKKIRSLRRCCRLLSLTNRPNDDYDDGTATAVCRFHEKWHDLILIPIAYNKSWMKGLQIQKKRLKSA